MLSQFQEYLVNVSRICSNALLHKHYAYMEHGFQQNRFQQNENKQFDILNYRTKQNDLHQNDFQKNVTHQAFRRMTCTIKLHSAA